MYPICEPFVDATPRSPWVKEPHPIPHPVQDPSERRCYITVLPNHNTDVPRTLVRDMHSTSSGTGDDLPEIQQGLFKDHPEMCDTLFLDTINAGSNSFCTSVTSTSFDASTWVRDRKSLTGALDITPLFLCTEHGDTGTGIALNATFNTLFAVSDTLTFVTLHTSRGSTASRLESRSSSSKASGSAWAHVPSSTQRDGASLLLLPRLGARNNHQRRLNRQHRLPFLLKEARILLTDEKAVASTKLWRRSIGTCRLLTTVWTTTVAVSSE
ncbi:hypothetical protein B0H17DRAFT_1191567 [Mycena rosella]|uniref:Uncharacterized protein n=1 Tax=Mycena rosella TaxID=1033263 RepID=A0AAD7GYC7_MYCRO|nr:hypothetical protein B0H17DRAFT_1191567 [Mycena rosella]